MYKQEGRFDSRTSFIIILLQTQFFAQSMMIFGALM